MQAKHHASVELCKNYRSIEPLLIIPNRTRYAGSVESASSKGISDLQPAFQFFCSSLEDCDFSPHPTNIAEARLIVSLIDKLLVGNRKIRLNDICVTSSSYRQVNKNA